MLAVITGKSKRINIIDICLRPPPAGCFVRREGGMMEGMKG